MGGDSPALIIAETDAAIFKRSLVIPMEREEIIIPPIVLEWSDWVPWNDLKTDARARQGVRVPNRGSGVYEVRYIDSEHRLTIGKASNLRRRIKQGMVKGKTLHSAGKRIRAHEDVSRLIVRWAMTDRLSAVEEELHKRYLVKFGSLPKFVKHT